MTQLEDDDEIETIEKHSFVYNKLNGIYKDIINDINFDKNIKLFLSCLSEELIDINYFNESSMTEREMKLVQKMLEKLVSLSVKDIRYDAFIFKLKKRNEDLKQLIAKDSLTTL